MASGSTDSEPCLQMGTQTILSAGRTLLWAPGFAPPLWRSWQTLCRTARRKTNLSCMVSCAQWHLVCSKHSVLALTAVVWVAFVGYVHLSA